MRTSRIPHPPGSRYLIVHHYLVKRFGFAAAAILGLLDFLDRAQPQPGMPLASRARIVAELEGIVGRDAVDKALKTLLDAGVIKKVKIVTPGEKNINVFVEYALCADAIPQAVAANGDDDGGDDGGSGSDSGGSGGDSTSGSGGSRNSGTPEIGNPGTPEIRSSGDSGNQESRGLLKSGLKSGVPDATYISKKEEEAAEEKKLRAAAASLKTSAREAASTGRRETTSTGRRRRVRPSGIVCWYDSDHDEAERLEKETNPDELAAAVQSVRSSGKEPVPGLVAMEIERLRKRREAETARARLIATVAAPPDDPEALAKGQKILESLRRQRASVVSGRTPTATPVGTLPGS